MKKEYKKPIFEIETIEVEDIITESGLNNRSFDDGNNPDITKSWGEIFNS